MKLCRVLIPFHSLALGRDLSCNDEVELTDEQIANVLAVNVNMVEILGEVEAKPKKKAKTKE
jgi:hypothetical protein